LIVSERIDFPSLHRYRFWNRGVNMAVILLLGSSLGATCALTPKPDQAAPAEPVLAGGAAARTKSMAAAGRAMKAMIAPE
jgi:hypothetical protein